MNTQYWKCRRCNSVVDMDAFKCKCVESPSPWEPITSFEYLQRKMHENTTERLEKWKEILDGGMTEPKDAILLYSPPHMPLHPNLQDIWSVILSLGIMDVSVEERNGKLGVVVHKDQTIKFEKDKFYPIENCGGDEQQKAFKNS